jgi:hypothetical protein
MAVGAVLKRLRLPFLFIRLFKAALFVSNSPPLYGRILLLALFFSSLRSCAIEVISPCGGFVE